MPNIDVNGTVVHFPDSLSGEELRSAVETAAGQVSGKGESGFFKTNDIDVPYTWYEFFVSEWAARICEQFEEAKKDRLPELQTAAMAKRLLAASEDRDPSPIIIKPYLAGYYYGR